MEVPEITNPRIVPPEFKWVAEITETDVRKQDDRRTFFAYGPMLVLVKEYTSRVKTDPGTGQPAMRFSQMDFPMDTAGWIVEELEPFATGGILPGTMARLDTEIATEKVCLIRGPGIGGPNTPGWELMNYSRKFRNDDLDRFQAFPMSDPFLWEQGMFDLWTNIAARHEKGEF